MKICADGYMQIAQPKPVRTPGDYDSGLDPVPPEEAVSFLLSHTFPGHRKIVRGPRPSECRLLHRALWAESVNERMDLVDRVWRAMTEPAVSPRNGKAELVQVIRCANGWAYPVYLEGASTRVIPEGGLPVPELNGLKKAPSVEVGS